MGSQGDGKVSLFEIHWGVITIHNPPHQPTNPMSSRIGTVWSTFASILHIRSYFALPLPPFLVVSLSFPSLHNTYILPNH